MHTSLISRYKFLILALFSFCATCIASAGNKFDDAVKPIADLLDGIVFYSVPLKIGDEVVKFPIILAILGGTAIFLTFYFKFINLRGFGLAIRTVKGKYTDKDSPGQITHFQALTAALSATVGLGNIAGVAVAVGIGGPGATFWMILMGLCGMTTKFVECTLGVKYRKFDKKGRTHGGAMYYLRDGLKERGLGGLGKGLAVFFAVMCIAGAIGAGNMFQVNQAATQFSSAFLDGGGDNTNLIFGIVIAVIVGMVILGGIVSIARVTSFLVPFMCITYLIAAAYILLVNAGSIPSAVSEIVKGAFAPMAIGGGIIGVLIQGIKRAAFSNEAGIGSAPIAHSAVKTKKPASEGLVALLEPFSDTVVVCTMTALVLVITGAWKVDGLAKNENIALYEKPALEQAAVLHYEKGDALRIVGSKTIGEGDAAVDFGEVLTKDGKKVWVNMSDVDEKSGVSKTSLAFEGQFSWFPKVLSIAVILFAFSTMISWSFYGEQAVQYLCGEDNKIAGIIYKVGFCIFTVIGAATSLDMVIKLSDAMLFAMVIPNMIGVYLLLPVVKRELEDFKKHAKEIDSGEKQVS